MPSDAYDNFLYMRKDVLDLITAHYYANKELETQPEQLGYLVRSAVVMLCAAWERYNEDVLIESIDLSLEHATDSSIMPDEVRKRLSMIVKKSNNELAPMQLADLGWKVVWRDHAVLETERLNTPNRENLNMLFSSYLGLPEYSRFWTDEGRTTINPFVRDRGEIAHNGNRGRNISIDELRTYQDMVIACVIEIDHNLGLEIGNRSGLAGSPWSGTYTKDLDKYEDNHDSE